MLVETAAPDTEVAIRQPFGRRVLRSFAVLSAGDLSANAIGFLLLIYLARVLGTDGLGRITFAQVLAGYFAALGELGLTKYSVREAARLETKDGEMIANIVSLRVVASLVSFVLLVATVLLIPKPLDVKILTLLYGVSFLVLAFTVDWFFQGREEMRVVAISHVLRQLAYGIPLLLIVRSPRNLTAIPLLQVFGYAVAAGFLIWWLHRTLHAHFHLNWNWVQWKRIMSSSVPILGANLMILVYYKVDHLMVGFMRSNRELGLYGVANQMTFGILLTFTSLLTSSFYPRLSSCHPDRQEFSKVSKAFMIICAVWAAAITFGAFIFGRSIIVAAFGPNYAGAVAPLRFLALAQAFIALGGPFATGLLVVGLEKQLLLITTIAAVINIVANFMLIPKYGIVGASIATAAAELGSAVMVTWQYSRYVLAQPTSEVMI